MKASSKSSKKQSERPFNARSWVGRYKFLTVFAFLIIAIALTVVGCRLYTHYADEADRKNVSTMKSSMERVKARFANADKGVTWGDGSHCTIAKPRAFGENTKYSCTISYKSSQAVSGQDKVKRTIDDDLAILRSDLDIISKVDTLGTYPVFTEDFAILNKKDYERLAQIASINFSLKGTSSQTHCSVNYALTQGDIGKVVLLNTELRCITDSLKAYFGPVEEA